MNIISKNYSHIIIFNLNGCFFEFNISMAFYSFTMKCWFFFLQMDEIKLFVLAFCLNIMYSKYY